MAPEQVNENHSSSSKSSKSSSLPQSDPASSVPTLKAANVSLLKDEDSVFRDCVIVTVGVLLVEDEEWVFFGTEESPIDANMSSSSFLFGVSTRGLVETAAGFGFENDVIAGARLFFNCSASNSSTEGGVPVTGAGFGVCDDDDGRCVGDECKALEFRAVDDSLSSSLSSSPQSLSLSQELAGSTTHIQCIQ